MFSISKNFAKSSTILPENEMARRELTPEENLKLLREIEANRAFILLAYQSNPELLKRADPEIKRLFPGDCFAQPEPGPFTELAKRQSA